MQRTINAPLGSHVARVNAIAMCACNREPARFDVVALSQVPGCGAKRTAKRCAAHITLPRAGRGSTTHIEALLGDQGKHIFNADQVAVARYRMF